MGGVRFLLSRLCLRGDGLLQPSHPAVSPHSFPGLCHLIWPMIAFENFAVSKLFWYAEPCE